MPAECCCPRQPPGGAAAPCPPQSARRCRDAGPAQQPKGNNVCACTCGSASATGSPHLQGKYTLTTGLHSARHGPAAAGPLPSTPERQLGCSLPRTLTATVSPVERSFALYTCGNGWRRTWDRRSTGQRKAAKLKRCSVAYLAFSGSKARDGQVRQLPQLPATRHIAYFVRFNRTAAFFHQTGRPVLVSSTLSPGPGKQLPPALG